ncbi:MAG: DNA-binding protein [Desulfurococcales archaeon ex4484_204]|nr:MAG: DNA-binding protein [Desulfurococcales archaeon ex4484_204]
MSFEEAEVIRRRAESFLRNAARLIEEGEYDLGMFSLEQYCQLILKYKLLVKKGSYPRTHSLRRLIRELGEFNPGILDLVNKVGNLHYIARLEEAYIASRYLPIVYEEGEVKDMLRFVLEVFKPVAEAV